MPSSIGGEEHAEGGSDDRNGASAENTVMEVWTAAEEMVDAAAERKLGISVS